MSRLLAGDSVAKGWPRILDEPAHRLVLVRAHRVASGVGAANVVEQKVLAARDGAMRHRAVGARDADVHSAAILEQSRNELEEARRDFFDRRAQQLGR